MKQIRICLDAGLHNRVYCPVSVELPWTYKEFPGVALRDGATEKVIPAQVAKGRRGVAVLHFLAPELKVGEKRHFLAQPLPIAEEMASGVRLMADKPAGKVDVHVGGSLFTSYNYGPQWVRPFLYPVIGPKGTQVTRNWPIVQGVESEALDHEHHKSIYVAYGEIELVDNDHEDPSRETGVTDNWSEEPGHGWQRHRGFASLQSGPVYGEIVARNDWTTHGGRKQLEEQRTMRFYALPGGDRLLDVEVAFKTSEGPVIFRDTKEGGLLSVRVATSMDVDHGGMIQNALGGVNEAETWGKRSPWCDYNGMVNGHHVGIAVMDHDDNPRYPTAWHVRNYGLFSANCFAWQYYRPDRKRKGDMFFAGNQTTTWKYRVYIHKGDAVRARVADRFMDYIEPAVASVE